MIAAARLGKAGGRSLIVLGTVNFVLAALVGLFLTGGRTTLFYALLLVLVSLYLSGRRLTVAEPADAAGRRRRAAARRATSRCRSWTRARASATNPERVLEHTQRAEYRPWLAGAAQANPVLATTLVSVGYFALAAADALVLPAARAGPRARTGAPTRSRCRRGSPRASRAPRRRAWRRSAARCSPRSSRPATRATCGRPGCATW